MTILAPAVRIAMEALFVKTHQGFYDADDQPTTRRSNSRSFISASDMAPSVYDFTVKNAKGEDTALKNYQGNVSNTVNVASEYGSTNSNYTQLKVLLDQYKKKGLEMLAFPCYQLANHKRSCETDIAVFVADKFKFKPTLSKKINVKGDDADPSQNFSKQKKEGLTVKSIEWNFTKFLIGKDGHFINRYTPTTVPKEMKADIIAAFQA